ncbi:hypothetical protein AURDEDRAFT_114881 [Auricularia subglabra TFB-10046 SS5]|nr:hypothetical protein AURDEDRAFT_114881 [Auricularia subglabra TFB-10046 SS5]
MNSSPSTPSTPSTSRAYTRDNEPPTQRRNSEADADEEEAEFQPPARPLYSPTGPYSQSTPTITLSPPSASSKSRPNGEPEPLRLPPRSTPTTPQRAAPRHAQTLPLPSRFAPKPMPAPRPIPPSQGDESMQLALVLAFGNDKYSGALSPAPPMPMHRPHSTPPTPTTAQSPQHPHRLYRQPRQMNYQKPPPLDMHFSSDYQYSEATSPSPRSASSTQSAPSFRTGVSGARRSAYNLNSQPLRKPEGTLMVPIPLMLRPRPLWRTTPRSALYSPAYAPAAHLVRRSTFIAAGLDLAAPVADLSALGVETRALMFGRDAGVILPGFDV